MSLVRVLIGASLGCLLLYGCNSVAPGTSDASVLMEIPATVSIHIPINLGIVSNNSGG